MLSILDTTLRRMGHMVANTMTTIFIESLYPMRRTAIGMTTGGGIALKDSKE
jgi:hypothetical protein